MTVLTLVRLINWGNNHFFLTRRQDPRQTDNLTEETLGYVLITDDPPCGHSLYLLEGGATWVGEVGGAARGMEGMEMVGDWTRSRYNLTERNDKEAVWGFVA